MLFLVPVPPGKRIASPEGTTPKRDRSDCNPTAVRHRTLEKHLPELFLANFFCALHINKVRKAQGQSTVKLRRPYHFELVGSRRSHPAEFLFNKNSAKRHPARRDDRLAFEMNITRHALDDCDMVVVLLPNVCDRAVWVCMTATTLHQTLEVRGAEDVMSVSSGSDNTDYGVMECCTQIICLLQCNRQIR